MMINMLLDVIHLIGFDFIINITTEKFYPELGWNPEPLAFCVSMQIRYLRF